MARIYISGPMTGTLDADGVETWNFPLFRATAARLRDMGHTPLDPSAGKDPAKPWPRHDAMRRDFHLVLMADAIAVLLGWARSNGARAEVLVAHEMGVPILSADTLEPIDYTYAINFESAS